MQHAASAARVGNEGSSAGVPQPDGCRLCRLHRPCTGKHTKAAIEGISCTEQWGGGQPHHPSRPKRCQSCVHAQLWCCVSQDRACGGVQCVCRRLQASAKRSARSPLENGLGCCTPARLVLSFVKRATGLITTSQAIKLSQDWSSSAGVSGSSSTYMRPAAWLPAGKRRRAAGAGTTVGRGAKLGRKASLAGQNSAPVKQRPPPLRPWDVSDEESPEARL